MEPNKIISISDGAKEFKKLNLEQIHESLAKNYYYVMALKPINNNLPQELVEPGISMYYFGGENDKKEWSINGLNLLQYILLFYGNVFNKDAIEICMLDKVTGKKIMSSDNESPLQF